MTTQTIIALLGVFFGVFALIMPACEEADKKQKASDAATVHSQSYYIKNSEYMTDRAFQGVIDKDKKPKTIQFRNPEISVSTTFKNNDIVYQVYVPYINEHGDPDFKLQSESRR